MAGLGQPITCACRKGVPEWRVHYEGLKYHVCTECLHGRLDAADEFPTFEPDFFEPFQEWMLGPEKEKVHDNRDSDQCDPVG